MDFLRPENLLRFGYKDCVLCEVRRPGEEKPCRNCSGRLGQRDRLLWEIHRERIRRAAGKLSLVYPGLGHLYSGRIAYGIFWALLLPLSLGLVLNVWSGITFGHGFLLLVGAPRPFKSPATTPQRKNMASPGGFEPPSPP